MWQPADMDMDGGGMISRSGAPRNSQFGDFAKIVSRGCAALRLSNQTAGKNNIKSNGDG
jgi:hypothetical protein